MVRVLAALAVLLLPLSAAAQEKVLRAVMHADVRVIDPVWTTQTIANIHGALVYDTLFGNDADQKPQPQMVGKYEISPDRLHYSFTLRDGLKFHDGSPVTTKDVIASLKRWGAKDGVGQRLMGYVTALDAVDDKTFKMVLREPYGMVLESLGKTGSSIAAIMREKDAQTEYHTGEHPGPRELMGQWPPRQSAVAEPLRKSIRARKIGKRKLDLVALDSCARTDVQLPADDYGLTMDRGFRTDRRWGKNRHQVSTDSTACIQFSTDHHHVTGDIAFQ